MLPAGSLEQMWTKCVWGSRVCAETGAAWAVWGRGRGRAVGCGHDLESSRQLQAGDYPCQAVRSRGISGCNGSMGLGSGTNQAVGWGTVLHVVTVKAAR